MTECDASVSTSWLCEVDKQTLPQNSTHFLDHTARNPKVKLLTMAKMKPPQLKLSSAADAIATPACSGSTGCHT